jgi:hypothetical protein
LLLLCVRIFSVSRLHYLRFDPIKPLLNCGIDPIVYFARRDLLDEKVGDIRDLWETHKAHRILNRQKPDGRWEYPNPKERIRIKEHYDQVETLRQLGFLVEHFGFDKRHPALQRAKKFVFKYQTDEGDIRGIYWNQYSPNYTAAFLELFCKAGYRNDPGVVKGLNWLLSIRQDDGGWAIPFRTQNKNLLEGMGQKQTLQPDKSKPFSAMVTGVVLRAFAYHPDYRARPEVKGAAELVLSSLFTPDRYPDRKSAAYWTRFSFPFWFTDLISLLDPVSKLGFTPAHPKVAEGLEWFVNQQKKDGTWDLKLLKGEKREQPFWMGLNICRLLKTFDLKIEVVYIPKKE